MLNFPKQLKKHIEEVYARFEREKDQASWRGSVRVVSVFKDGLKREARSGEHRWIADSRKDVGGAGSAPGPLQYFISGLPFCQQSHYAERSLHMNMKIHYLEIDVRAHYDTRPGGFFDEVTYETKIQSPEAETKIKELVLKSENDCYVTNTIAKAAKITGTITLNEKKLMETHPGGA